jgi:hypothetical protein
MSSIVRHLQNSKNTRARSGTPRRRAVPIVTHPPGNGALVYFLEGRGETREIVEEVVGGKLGPRELRPVEVPVGYFLTETTGKRIKVSDTDLFGFHLMAVMYLVPDIIKEKNVFQDAPEWVKDVVVSLRDWYVACRTPRARYTTHWDGYLQRGIQEAFRVAQGGSPSDSKTMQPFNLHETIMARRDLILRLDEMVERWRDYGIRIPPGDEPLFALHVRASVDPVLFELWWLIENNRTVRWCKDPKCGATFVPSGRRSWRQRYCFMHRNQGSTPRERARRGLVG